MHVKELAVASVSETLKIKNTKYICNILIKLNTSITSKGVTHMGLKSTDYQIINPTLLNKMDDHKVKLDLYKPV